MRRHAGGLLEHAREMERAQLRQRRQRLDWDAFGQVPTHMVLDLAEPCDRKAAALASVNASFPIDYRIPAGAIGGRTAMGRRAACL
jgi:hypothetical protein